MRVKIEADGEPLGTRIYADDGKDITDHATEVVWRHRAGELPTAEVTLCCTPISGHGHARMVGPNGKDVRMIQYMDGTEERFDGVTPVSSLADSVIRWVSDGTGGQRPA